jgi:hypothetical protein
MIQRRNYLNPALILPVILLIFCGSKSANACYSLTVSASPVALYVNGRTSIITATVTDGAYHQPVSGHTIQFSVSGPTNPGSVSPTSAVTGSDGTATTTYTSGASYGIVTITAMDETQPGSPHPSKSCTVTVFEITQSRRIWWFDNVSPGNQPANYFLDAVLTANGSSTGTFAWQVTAGFDDAGFVNGSNIVDSITLSNNNQVTLKAKDESEAPSSVHIKFTYNSIVIINTWNTTVRTADHLSLLANNTTSDATWGYDTQIHYKVIDNVGDDFPNNNIGINEEWITEVVSDYTGMDWRRGDAGGTTVNPLNWYDHIQGETSSHTPTPVGPSDSGAATAVYHWGQRWRVGSVTPAVGVPVQDNTLQKYRGYANHL